MHGHTKALTLKNEHVFLVLFPEFERMLHLIMVGTGGKRRGA